MRKLILVILFVLVPVCAFANMCNYEQLAEIDNGHCIHWAATEHSIIPFREMDRISITANCSKSFCRCVNTPLPSSSLFLLSGLGLLLLRRYRKYHG